jgi:hypothetical protein
MRKRYAAHSTSPSKASAPMSSAHGLHAAPPPAKKMKTEVNSWSNAGSRGASTQGGGGGGAQVGAAHAGLCGAAPFASRTSDARSKLSSTTAPAMSVVQPRSAPNSHRRRSLQDRQVESIGWMAGRSGDDALGPSLRDGDGLRRGDAALKGTDLLGDDRRHLHLCDDRLSGEPMGMDDTDLSHLSAEATLPLLDSTRSFLQGSDSPGASGIGGVGGGAGASTPSASHSCKMLMSDMTLSASRLVSEAVCLPAYPISYIRVCKCV